MRIEETADRRGAAVSVILERNLFGAALTGDTREQVFFILHGTGANGKSTLLNVMLEILGDYALQASPKTLTLKRDSNNSKYLASLKGARFVSAVEVG